MTKSFDAGLRSIIADFARGEFRPGRHDLGLATGGVDISYSGGFLDRYRPQIEAFREQIATGRIVVPDR